MTLIDRITTDSWDNTTPPTEKEVEALFQRIKDNCNKWHVELRSESWDRQLRRFAEEHKV